MGRIHHLPGTKLTPEVVLARTIDELARIKAVVIVIQWDDDSFDLDWSTQKTSEMSLGSMVFQREVMDIITRDSE